MMTWLAHRSDSISIDCGGDLIEVATRPLTFTSPMQFTGAENAIPTRALEREFASTEMDDAQYEDFEEEEESNQ